MKELVQNPALAAALISPCAILLAALELAFAVPDRPSRRFIMFRRVLLVISLVVLAALGALILARFSELRFK